MFSPQQQVKVRGTDVIGKVTRFYPADDEYLVEFPDGSTNYYLDGDLVPVWPAKRKAKA